MSNKRDDASAVLGIPYLNLLVSAATRQVVPDCAVCRGGILGGNTLLHLALLHYRLVNLWLFVAVGGLHRRSFVLQVLFHLLDALFCS